MNRIEKPMWIMYFLLFITGLVFSFFGNLMIGVLFYLGAAFNNLVYIIVFGNELFASEVAD